MITYECPECKEENEVYTDEGYENLRLDCWNCGYDYTHLHPEIYEDYISDQTAKAECICEGER